MVRKTETGDAVGIDRAAKNAAYGFGYERLDRGNWITASLVVPDSMIAAMQLVPAVDNPYEDEALRDCLDVLASVKSEPTLLSHVDAYNRWREDVNAAGKKLEAAGLLARADNPMSRAEIALYQESPEWELKPALFSVCAKSTAWPLDMAAVGEDGMTFYHYMALDTEPCVSVRVDGSARDDYGKLACNLVQVAVHLDLPAIRKVAGGRGKIGESLARLKR